MASERRVELMEFQGVPGDAGTFALVALGHVGYREFRRAVAARDVQWLPSALRPAYQYAVIRDDESIVFNVRPDETGAKPITVAYFGTEGPDQP